MPGLGNADDTRTAKLVARWKNSRYRDADDARAGRRRQDLAAEEPLMTATPRFGLGIIVRHRDFGRGRIVAYDQDRYVIVFPGGDAKTVAFSFDGLEPQDGVGDPELDRVVLAVRHVLGDHGWLDVDLELGKRWVGGTLKLVPGRDDAQAKDVPIEAFLKKLIGIRDRLRVLEQKINGHPSLSTEEKVELDGYITRCYGSLTTFNVLFANRASWFVGQGDKEN
jgi:hypothetical protein